MKQSYLPVRYIRSIESARAELPSIQECANKMLRRLETPFQCRLLPSAIVELCYASDPLTLEFRHDTNSPVVQLGRGATLALGMRPELHIEYDEDINALLETLILLEAPLFAGGKSFEEQQSDAAAAASLMLEPVRRVAINRRREAA